MIATTLAEHHQLLADLTLTMLRAAVGGDVKAAAWVLRAFPEGFGRVGEADAEAPSEGIETLTNEQLRLLGAALDAADAADAAGSEPSSL